MILVRGIANPVFYGYINGSFRDGLRKLICEAKNGDDVELLERDRENVYVERVVAHM